MTEKGVSNMQPEHIRAEKDFRSTEIRNCRVDLPLAYMNETVLGWSNFVLVNNQ
jgi:hypothetical protein